MNQEISKDLYKDFLNDFSNPAYGLRARMTFFFLNFYATPSSNVNEWLLMAQQYRTLFRVVSGTIGSWLWRCSETKP